MSMIDEVRELRTRTILDVLDRVVIADMRSAIKAIEENRTDAAHRMLTMGVECFDNLASAWLAEVQTSKEEAA